jgi:hypothetical protein
MPLSPSTTISSCGWRTPGAAYGAKTYEGYEGMLRLYASPAIGDHLLTDLTSLTVQRLYAQLLARGLSGGTVLNLHLVLTQSLGQAVKWGLLTANPVAGAQPPRPRRPELAIVDPSLAGRILAPRPGRFLRTIPGLLAPTARDRGRSRRRWARAGSGSRRGRAPWCP